jgi:Na+-translocating ferredoxin:NAD+ oxidoreductase RnfD subunit
MKTPTWAIIVGILMMLFAGCNLLGDIQRVNAPRLLDMQESMFTQITKTIEEAEHEVAEEPFIIVHEDSTLIEEEPMIAIKNDTMGLTQLTESFSQMLHVSDYMKKWMVRLGYMGMVVSVIYFLGGLFLLIKKKFSIKLVYGAIGLSIVFAVFKSIINTMDDSAGLISVFGNFGNYWSIFIDVILLVIVVASDKSAYEVYEVIDDQMEV